MIFDSHFHMGTPYVRQAPGDKFWGTDRVLRLLDQYSIKHAIVLATNSNNFKLLNNEINNEIKKSNGRLIGCVRVNPNNLTECLQDIDLRINKQGWKMIKLHPYLQSFPIDSQIVYPIFERAQSLKVPVLIHAGSEITNTPAQVAIVAELFPEVTIIMAHMGAPLLVEQSIIAAKLRPNIVLDTSGQLIPRMIKEAVKAIGPERVVFGSDGPYYDIGAGLQVIESSGLTNKEKNWVLGKSIMKILERSPS